MNKFKNITLCGLLLFGGHSAFAQPAPMNCMTTAGPVPVLRAEGRADLIADILLDCKDGDPASIGYVNISVFLNTNVTSNLTGPDPDEIEAMLLIDDPQPAPTVNVSNGITFPGQVKGTTGSLTSGNVFTGRRTGSVNHVVFLGIPVVPPGPSGTRRLRIVNVRALSPVATAPPTVLAFLAVSGPSVFPITNPVQTVGFVSSGLGFSFAHVGSNLQLTFKEQFPSAFKKRIENNGAGAAVKQDVPGVVYCTESGFTPDFGTTAPGAPGSANSATLLRAKITGIPPTVFAIFTPATMTAGSMVAGRTGPLFVPIVAGTATFDYEVRAAAPFAGVNGCATIENFVTTVVPFGFGSLANALATGSFAPVDATPVIDGPAPEPRFH